MHLFSVAVSIFSLPECKLSPNPGDSNPSEVTTELDKEKARGKNFKVLNNIKCYCFYLQRDEEALYIEYL